MAINGLKKHIIIIGFCILLVPNVILSQNSVISNVADDSLRIKAVVDSAQLDSAQTDTTQVKPEAGLQLTGPITYEAAMVSVSRTGHKIYLNGDAKVVYQDMILEAAKITINQDTHTLYAEGIVDTVDSLGKPVLTGTPVFTEKGEEPMQGNTLFYDFTTNIC